MANTLQELMEQGLLVVGEGTTIEDGVELCHPTRSGEQLPVVIGKDCYIRSGTVIYSGVHFGDGSQTGHHVMIRENTRIGSRSVVGTGAVVEFGTTVGDHVMIETNTYVTANMVVEDYVFLGPCVVTTNDKRMLWRRDGANQFLQGPTIRRGCRVGGGSILLPGITLGQNAMVGAGSVVTKDVPAGKLVFGNPAQVMGDVPEEEYIPEE